MLDTGVSTRHCGRRSSRSSRARHSSISGASRMRLSRCSTRSSSGGSAQWTSSNTRTSGRRRASASNSSVTARVRSSRGLVTSSRPAAWSTRSATSAARGPSGQRRDQGRVQVAPARKLAHDLAERPVGDALAVGQAAAGQHGCPVAQGAVQLAGQPGLADAGRAEHDHALRRALVGDALEGLAQGPQLRVAALQRRAGRAALLAGRPAQAPDGQRLGLAAHRQRRQRLDRDGAGDQAPGGVADQRLSGGRRLLKPRGDVHGVTGHQRLAGGRVPCDHVAAVDAGPDRDLDSPLALQVLVHAGQLLLELLGRADRPQRMVLERDRVRRRRPSPRRR